MAGQNTLIIATDYNEIQSKIATVMGSGSGNIGYGQTLASSQVGQNSKITVAQWSNLRTDIVKCRQHQTGTTIGSIAPGEVGYVAGSNLPIPTTAKQVQESWRAAFKSMAIDCETDAIPVNPRPNNQVTTGNLVGQQIRTTAWNGVISQTVIVTWSNADEARAFWNTGGQIEVTADRSGGSAGLKNTTWTTMLTSAATVSMNYTKSSTTGSGIVSTLGWYDLTTSDNLIFEKDAPTGNYTPNKYYIYARVNDTGANRRILYFTIYFADDSLAPASYPDAGFGVDENVDGTLNTLVQVRRATGSNVSVPLPPASSTAIA